MIENFEATKYNALDNAWKDFVKYDVLPKAKQKDWDKKLQYYEGESLNINSLYQFIETTFEVKDVERIYAKAHKLKEESEKAKEKRSKEEMKISMAASLPSLNIQNFMFNAERFYEAQPFFYDKNKLFWLWNKEENKYERVDETDIMDMFDMSLGFEGQTVTSSIKNNHLEAFERFGRRNMPNDAPLKWVQFKDKAYSIESGNVYDVQPNYFFTNPIPWELGKTSETPTMDKLFTEWVGEQYVDDLYEIIAYCCFRSYPIQILICLYGVGRNGKTQYLKLIDKFVGNDNITSTELDLLAGNNSSRFESSKLYKKLVCLMGETNFGVLDKSSLLKKLVGGDKIGFEMKNKPPFSEYNYAKLIIASNSLPSSEDTSEGFYRRWHIITFPNQFKEGKDIIESIPKQEFKNLAKKCTEILPNLLDHGEFKNQGTIVQRKEKYIMASNPLPIFLSLHCERDETTFVSYQELYTLYVQFLLKNKKRKVKIREFRSALEDEGFFIERTSKKVDDDFKNGQWVNGLYIKNCVICVDSNKIPNSIKPPISELEIPTQSTQSTQKELSVEEETILSTKPLDDKDVTT